MFQIYLKFIKFSLSVTALSLCAMTISTTASAQETDTSDTTKAVYIFNWSDYIDPKVIKDFEQETGIKVHYSLMDSNEMLEAKLIAGSSGYDIVAPSLHVVKRLSQVGLLQPLDKDQLPNLKHLDPDKMAKIAQVDPDNTYAIPYIENSTSIAYNERKIKEIMGKDFVVDSWDVLFVENIISQLQKCGVTALDSPSDMICSALIYLGKDPESTNQTDYKEAEKLLNIMSRHVLYFHNSRYVNDLASGDICMAVAWSSDAQIANVRATEAGKDPIKYVIPKEGILMGYDMFAIPKDAKNVKNAHIFLNYILRPDVMAKISNYIHAANANKDATALMNKEITSNPGIYYDKETLKRMHIVVPPLKIERNMTRLWNRVRVSSGYQDFD